MPTNGTIGTKMCRHISKMCRHKRHRRHKRHKGHKRHKRHKRHKNKCRGENVPAQTAQKVPSTADRFQSVVVPLFSPFLLSKLATDFSRHCIPRVGALGVLAHSFLRDQLHHLTGGHDALRFAGAVDGADAHLADDGLELRPWHAVAHADVVQEVIDAVRGDGRRNHVELARMHGGLFDDVLPKALRIGLRVAATDGRTRSGVNTGTRVSTRAWAKFDARHSASGAQLTWSRDTPRGGRSA